MTVGSGWGYLPANRPARNAEEIEIVKSFNRVAIAGVGAVAFMLGLAFAIGPEKPSTPMPAVKTLPHTHAL